MGVWAVDPFGNDDACDWAYELEACVDLTFIEETLDEALAEAEEYLEAPTACRALAAAEVLARLQGRGGSQNAYTQAADDWVTQHQKLLSPTPKLKQKTIRTLQTIIGENSELVALWQDSAAFEEWVEEVKNLAVRVLG